MSDIRFNSWYHRSGTGGVFQASNGRVGIGSTIPQSQLDLNGGTLIGDVTGNATGLSGTPNVVVGIVTATEIAGVSTIGVTTVTATTLTVNGNNYPSAGPLSNRNLIINGAMQVAQRGTATFTGSGQYPVDRFRQNSSTAAVITGVQSAATPAGFLNSIKLENTSADSSIDAGDHWSVQQVIEGYNIQHLNWGTADAKNVTVSFWARSSQTGTFCLILLGAADGTNPDKSYVSEYTINTANTYEYKSITVPGPTTGTAWSNSNNRGIIVRWGLSCGTNGQQAADSWGTTNASGSSNQTQLLSTINSTFYLTGVQVEDGSVATPFEHRSFGDELARCQRYYCHSYPYGTTPGSSTSYDGTITTTAYSTINYTSPGTGFFPVQMSSAPNVTLYSPVDGAAGQIASDNTNGAGVVAYISDKSFFPVRSNNSTGVVANSYIRVHYTAAAEL